MRAEWVVQNPQASQPLVIDLSVECNTPTERILDNIQRNSAGRKGWQKLEEPHERIAVLCGSGPSLADTLGEIHGDVFALNGAAAFLERNGILPDYQVILDAKPETVSLIGPAKQHLFASQVDPECFRRVPTAKLWHATHGDIAPDFPDYEGDYCLIGGTWSVGNSALVLAYAMGYRTIHCHGFDSSHRAGKGHAFAQPMNDGDPTTIVTFGGREYVASLVMALKARYFMSRAAELKRGGCEIHVHGSGLLPDMFNAPPMAERDKYAAMWQFPEYREIAPGELCVDRFLAVAKPSGRVIDFGCGTGRAGLKLKAAGLDVLLVDFADGCRDPEAMRLPFIEHDLTKPFHDRAPFGYCTDVMEHIPPQDVELVVSNVLSAAETVFFQISTVPDSMGALIGQQLHLTVQPHSWWRELFKGLGYLVQWDEEQPEASLFLVTNRKLN